MVSSFQLEETVFKNLKRSITVNGCLESPWSSSWFYRLFPLHYITYMSSNRQEYNRKCLGKLAVAILNNPDMRFGQLVENLFCPQGRDLFYVEPEESYKYSLKKSI